MPYLFATLRLCDFATPDSASSVPTQTNPNRAYSLIGTSMGREANQIVKKVEEYRRDPGAFEKALVTDDERSTSFATARAHPHASVKPAPP